jgi:LPS-assembly protein
VFDDTLLFDVDKFSGYDRLETGARFNAGLQYVFQANNGFYARAVFGQSYHLAGDNPYTDPGQDPTGKLNFSPVSGLETDRSDYVAGIGLRLTDNWSVAGMMRYDIDAKDRIQDQIQLKYSDECFVLTASYTETFVENAALDLRPDRTLMLRFELKYLGQYSYKTDSLDHVFGDTRSGAH